MWAQIVWSRFHPSCSERGCQMELFLFAVGNFLGKSILLTQHNWSQLFVLSISNNNKKCSHKTPHDRATLLAGFHLTGLSWMDHHVVDKGWTVKYTGQELKTTGKVSYAKIHTEWGEKSAWETLVISSPKKRCNSSWWIALEGDSISWEWVMFTIYAQMNSDP